MELVLGKLREKLLGRGHTVSVAEQLQQLLPVDIAVQPNPEKKRSGEALIIRP